MTAAGSSGLLGFSSCLSVFGGLTGLTGFSGLSELLGFQPFLTFLFLLEVLVICLAMTSTVGSAIVSKYVCLSCGVIAVPAVAVHNGGMIFTHQHHAVLANDDVTSRIGCALFGTHHYTSRIHCSPAPALSTLDTV